MKNYKTALCREHQKSFSNLNPPETTNNSNNNGLSIKERSYRENMIKGRIAEALIEELFLTLDYSVFRYGIENTVPGVMRPLKGVDSDVARSIRRMPDFVVQDNSNGAVYFIDVKFRANEEFKFKDLKDYPYKDCYFIVVSKKHIKCITYDELERGNEITPTSTNYLSNKKEFGLDKEVIIKFRDLAVKFFKVV
ncbi:MAG: hypothetical protein WBD09_04055 [Halobacteriota archaeon]